MIYDAYCKSNDRPRAQSFLRILTSPSPSSCKFFDLKSFERIVEATRFEGIVKEYDRGKITGITYLCIFLKSTPFPRYER